LHVHYIAYTAGPAPSYFSLFIIFNYTTAGPAASYFSLYIIFNYTKEVETSSFPAWDNQVTYKE
jgi:hypothetical protein